MLEFGDEDFVTGLDTWAHIALGDEIDAVGRAACVDHFGSGAGVDEVHKPVTGPLVGTRGAL